MTQTAVRPENAGGFAGLTGPSQSPAALLWSGGSFGVVPLTQSRRGVVVFAPQPM